jgi:ribosomal protein S18 acetylase RimI-like enzyme
MVKYNSCGEFLPFVEYIFDGMVGYSSSDSTGGMTLEVSTIFEVRVGNHAAQRLYRSMGFMKIGYIPFYYQDGEGAIMMRKVM